VTGRLRPKARAVSRIGAAAFAGGLIASAATAQDARQSAQTRLHQAFSTSFGTRLWFSTGRTGKSLYDFDGSTLISRLTYDDLRFPLDRGVRRTSISTRVFLKGNAGVGGNRRRPPARRGFQPFTFPYSSTDSAQKSGDLAYATIDLGGYFVDTKWVKLGGFAGYNLLHQQVDAFGCEQAATSFICLPAIPETVAVISQENDWESLRLD